MVVVNVIRGGLGNQLFQWSISKIMELKFDADVYMDTQYVGGGGGITSRKLELDQFSCIKYKILDNEGFDKYRQKPVVELNEGNFDIRTYKLSNEHSYRLMDYWQNVNYFEGYESEIKKDLSPDKKFLEDIYTKYPQLKNNSVSIHVRRTDYLSSNGYHPVQPISYYEKSLEIIGEYDNLFIFSDDIEWCEQNLKFKNQIFVKDNPSSYDIWMMSLCRHNIIANSSFSWWGAWLNENPNKKVVSPSHWFQWGGVPFMIPKNWIVI